MSFRFVVFGFRFLVLRVGFARHTWGSPRPSRAELKNQILLASVLQLGQNGVLRAVLTQAREAVKTFSSGGGSISCAHGVGAELPDHRRAFGRAGLRDSNAAMNFSLSEDKFTQVLLLVSRAYSRATVARNASYDPGRMPRTSLPERST